MLRTKSILVAARQGRSGALPSLLRQLSTAPKRLPLEGVRVVDLTRVLAGPYCTQILGDLGAEIIKVEHPTRGDDTRAWGPPFAAPMESAYFLGVNRNKKSIGLNFQSEKGREVIQKLVKTADVVVENYLPGSLAKYGLSYDQLSVDHEKLIYASITGYGQTGPFRSRPGYDVMVEAEFGLMHITGEANGPPVKVGVAVTDLTAGLYAANAIMASLIHRGVTGQGQYLDICLSDCQLATLANIASSVLVSGEPDSGRHGTAHPSICPYQAFDTAQSGSIMLGGGNDNLFRKICDALGKPEWKEDPRYLTNALRVANKDTLVPAIQDITTQKTTEEWLELFKDKGFPYAAVNDVKTALFHEHSIARNMIVETEHPSFGTLKMVNFPVKFSQTQPEVRLPPPSLGSHTSETLEMLGYSTKSITELRTEGVVA